MLQDLQSYRLQDLLDLQNKRNDILCKTSSRLSHVIHILSLIFSRLSHSYLNTFPGLLKRSFSRKVPTIENVSEVRSLV